MTADYQPAEYWSDRLAEVGGLRSTGHVSYGEVYNRWLYKRKGVVLARALRDVRRVDRALDLGSGVGWVVEQLQRAGAQHVHGVDISDAAVAELRRRFPTWTFDTVRLGEQPVPAADGSFDVATFLDVAYHIVDDALWEATVADAARLLVRGGGLVVIDAFAPTEIRPASHVRFRAADRWHEHAEAVGLQHVSTTPCYRWLSRSRGASQLRRLPETARAVIEYGLDAVLPSPAHLSCAVYRKG
jgi:SAM-dependent methyltransferase